MKQAFSVLLICLTVFLSQKASRKPLPSVGGYYVEESIFPVYVEKELATPKVTPEDRSAKASRTGIGLGLRFSAPPPRIYLLGRRFFSD